MKFIKNLFQKKQTTNERHDVPFFDDIDDEEIKMRRDFYTSLYFKRGRIKAKQQKIKDDQCEERIDRRGQRLRDPLEEEKRLARQEVKQSWREKTRLNTKQQIIKEEEERVRGSL